MTETVKTQHKDNASTLMEKWRWEMMKVEPLKAQVGRCSSDDVREIVGVSMVQLWRWKKDGATMTA